jgi:hypothetical protein
MLLSRLEPVSRRYRGLRLWRRLTICWGLALLAGISLQWWQHWTGYSPPQARTILGAITAAAALGILANHMRWKKDPRLTAEIVEHHHPELQGLLLTAVQQTSATRDFSYMQYRLIQEAIEHSRTHHWGDAVNPRLLNALRALHFVALSSFVVLLGRLPVSGTSSTIEARGNSQVEITPGDTSIERGASLVVLARFTRITPVQVDLLIQQTTSNIHRMPLVKNLSDPVFGGTLSEVTNDLFYHVEYGDQRSRDFQVKVYEHPRLERADVELDFPTYTGVPSKRIENTRRISAVEGTSMDLQLQFNKPVLSAQLVGRHTNASTLTLEVAPDRPLATLHDHMLTSGGAYDLRLVDHDRRTNKHPAQFVLDVLKNRAPELKLAAPRGDLRPSALEEVRFEGTVWDDFGIQAYGLAFTHPDKKTRFIELGRELKGQTNHSFKHLLRLEESGIVPDQLISWYMWSDDLGPDGRVRRTVSDLFFAEVRPFEEIFREASSSEGSSEDSSGEQADSSGQGATRLLELQKQVITATWNLQRQHPRDSEPYRRDIVVVRDGQAQVIEQAKNQQERANDLRAQTHWFTAIQSMNRALGLLNAATNSPAPLPEALTAEHTAYQALLALATREHEVARAQNRSRGQSNSEARQQRQIDQLDLRQSEQRYETQRQARPQQTAERQEQLQVLQRLQELARRQQDLNDRLKELQSALAEARSEQEQAEIRRQLKRLQAEEQQMLADVDELRQRLDRPENQSQMERERQQLDQTRQEVQQAAEAAAQGSVPQALASGTRAQQQLQDLRDGLRKQSASQFADEMRQMRSDARDLAQAQEGIAQRLDSLDDPKRRTLNDTAQRQELLDQLDTQKNRLGQLMDTVTQVSKEAENSESLLSRQLYDTVRQFNQNDTAPLKPLQEDLLNRGLLTRSLYERFQKTQEQDQAKTLTITAELVRQGYSAQADQAELKARSAINELRTGIENAAESVLGDETEALRLARQELDELTDQLQRELARAGTGTSNTNRSERSGNVDRANRDSDNATNSAIAATATRNSQRAEANPANQDPEGESLQAANGSDRRADTQAGREQLTPNRQTTPQPNAPGQDRRQASRLSGNDPNRPDPDRLSSLDRLLTETDLVNPGPITGQDFAPWSDRLRDVEELLDDPEWRNQVASARERARQIRIDLKRQQIKPDWAVVRLNIVKPLVEVRDRIVEELARRESKDVLMPIDRDPVPRRYSEMVRRYYEELAR